MLSEACQLILDKIHTSILIRNYIVGLLYNQKSFHSFLLWQFQVERISESIRMVSCIPPPHWSAVSSIVSRSKLGTQMLSRHRQLKQRYLCLLVGDLRNFINRIMRHPYLKTWTILSKLVTGEPNYISCYYIFFIIYSLETFSVVNGSERQGLKNLLSVKCSCWAILSTLWALDLKHDITNFAVDYDRDAG